MNKKGLKQTEGLFEGPWLKTRRRIESLETELETLRALVQPEPTNESQAQSSVDMDTSICDSMMESFRGEASSVPMHRGPSTLASASNIPHATPPSYDRSSFHTLSPLASLPSTSISKKRKRAHFEVETPSTSDFVSNGLITVDEARLYFDTFFQGCHQYIPVFDSKSDSLEFIRTRSDVLFSTICATGCRILRGSDSSQWHLLNFHIKRILNAIIATPSKATLETIQALLVRACYVSERSLLVTLATRLAIDIGLPEAYDDMSARCIRQHSELQGRPSHESHGPSAVDESELLRKTRTWLQLLNLGHILHVDASDLLIFKFRGDVRRSRVLLQSTHSSDLDLHLISQVELNVHRANTYAALPSFGGLTDEETLDIVNDAKIDIDVWYNDWLRIFERSPSNKRWLALNLRIQQCWADTMTMCRAVRISGVENVEAMSPIQRDILLMAKDALGQHLGIIIEEPRDYLHNLRFAMDFVWAKCAFCFLLLLKLSTLLAQDEEHIKRKLIAQGQILLSELRSAGGNGNGGRSSNSRVYLQLLQSGIDKFSRTALGENVFAQEGRLTGTNTPRRRPETADQNEMDSFVPEQFVFEWDFPGLTLFSSPTTDPGWFDDFLRSALVGGEDFYSFGWNSVDISM